MAAAIPDLESRIIFPCGEVAVPSDAGQGHGGRQHVETRQRDDGRAYRFDGRELQVLDVGVCVTRRRCGLLGAS